MHKNTNKMILKTPSPPRPLPPRLLRSLCGRAIFLRDRLFDFPDQRAKTFPHPIIPFSGLIMPFPHLIPPLYSQNLSAVESPGKGFFWLLSLYCSPKPIAKTIKSTFEKGHFEASKLEKTCSHGKLCLRKQFLYKNPQKWLKKPKNNSKSTKFPEVRRGHSFQGPAEPLEKRGFRGYG